MKRLHTIRAAIVLLVMAIMTISCLISCGILIGFRVAGALEWTPVMLAVVMLLFSLIVGMLLALFVANRFLKPMNELIEASKRVAQGDFSVRVKIRKERSSEMNELQHSFNRMVSELQGIELYRTDFINNFSHEFKTPIVSVHGFAKQLKKPELGLEQRQEYLDIIIKESE
ncbi:MAG: HAMP domain-containing protein, partial [Clostridia bacterium]|nr:HAMP domain-containing protein [Clostridia bacterium]